MRKLLSTIALAALATATVHADPGGGKGHGGGKGEGNGAAQGYGNGDKHGQNGGKHDDRQVMMPQDRYGNGQSDSHRSASHGNKANHDRGNDRAIPVQAQVRGDNPYREDNQDRFDKNDRRDSSRVNWRRWDQRGLINGCPPGLAKKNNGCLPPGQAKKNDYDRHDRNWWGLRGLSDLSGYRYYDGNLVRFSPGGTIQSYYPLLGGALAVGNTWPNAWQPTPLPPYYNDYYGLNDNYRYFDGAIYNVDPTTSAIQKIAALLTGDNFAVGQRIPAGYDAYNVPYQYRDRYADGPDAQYRYSDGYVYQTDPKTQLIVAAIKLLS